MDQTDRNALDYESCRRVWRRVSPELDPYPEEKRETDCPAAPAPDLKGLQEMIEGELGDRRAYLEAARRAPNPAARRMMQRMAERVSSQNSMLCSREVPSASSEAARARCA